MTYTEANNYQANYNRKNPLNQSQFQQAPDVELYGLYWNESRLAVINNPPVLHRLPYSVLYCTGLDGPISDVVENRINLELKIDVDNVNKLLGQPRENAEQCCLRSFKLNESTLYLTYSRCEYLQSRASNIAPDRCESGLENRSLRRLLLQQRPGLLPELDNPAITNNIGVSVIAVSQDSYLIIQDRGIKVHSNANSWSASASGAVDWQDYADSDRLLHVNMDNDRTIEISPLSLDQLFGRKTTATDRGIIRELIEEIGLAPENIKSIRLVGIAREYRRLGKPEFFYVAETSIPVTQYQKASEGATYRWEYGNRPLPTEMPFPLDLNGQLAYLANRMNDHRYNEITRVAFYFMYENLLART